MSRNLKFEIGDVVMLESGSPAMTVSYVDYKDLTEIRINCTWFNDALGMQHGTFHPKMLFILDKPDENDEGNEEGECDGDCGCEGHIVAGNN